MDELYRAVWLEARIPRTHGSRSLKVPLVGSSYVGVSVSLDSAKTVNMFEEAADSPNAKAPSALITVPGARYLANSDGTNKAILSGYPTRGLYEMPPLLATSSTITPMLAVTSDHIYIVTLLNGIAGYNNEKTIPAKYTRAYFAESPTDIVMAVGGNTTAGFAYSVATSSWVFSDGLIFDAVVGDFVPLCDVVYLAGFFVGFCNAATGSSPQPFRQMFFSPTASGWSAANYFIASATADIVKKLIVLNGKLHIFKERTIPIYAPTGQANNPFAPIESATVNVGCLNGDTVAQEGNFVYWVGQDIARGGFGVYKLVGATAERISNGHVEKILQDAITNFGISGLDGISAYCKVERGHSLYLLSIPSMGITLGWDELTNKWHDRGWWNVDTGQYECEVGWVYANFNHLQVVGDRRLNLATFGSTALYTVSESFKDNNIEPVLGSAAHAAGTDAFIRWERTSPIIAGPNRERLFIGDVELCFEVGVQDATGAHSDPQVTLEISRDGGRTYGNARTKPIGKVGEYKNRCRFQMNGSGLDLVFRISGTSPVKLIAAFADIEEGI